MKKSLMALVLVAMAACASAQGAQAPPGVQQGIHIVSKQDTMQSGNMSAMLANSDKVGTMHAKMKMVIGGGSGEVRSIGLVPLRHELQKIGLADVKKVMMGGRAPPGTMIRTMFWLRPGAGSSYDINLDGAVTMPGSANQRASPMKVLRT